MSEIPYPKADFALLAQELERRRADLEPTLTQRLSFLKTKAAAKLEAERRSEVRREAEARTLDLAVRDALRVLFAFASSPEAARIAEATGQNLFRLPLTGVAARDSTVSLSLGARPSLSVWHRGGPPYYNVNWTIVDASELARKTGEDVRRALVEDVESGAVWAAIAREARATDIEKTLLERFGRDAR